MLNSVFWIGIGTYLLGLISGYFGTIRSLMFLSLRIPKKNIYQVYKYLSKNSQFKFNFNESLNLDVVGSIPETESSICWCNRLLLWLDISEKYLTAGFTSKETQGFVSIFRWQRSRFLKLLKEAEKIKVERDKVSIFITRYNSFCESHQLLKKKYVENVHFTPTIENGIDEIFSDFEEGKREKSGILLYGPPGNGKTSLIKKFAAKYDMDIYIPIIRPNMTNDEIIMMFGDIPIDKKAIIVLEDFDTLFHGRYAVIHDCKFTFDVFLNLLDGLYASLDNKIVFMTANEIDRIDPALKHRPSRFDYVTQIDNPNADVRRMLLQHSNLNGSLDNVVALLEGQSAAIVCEVAKRNLREDSLKEDINEIVNSFISEQQDVNSVGIAIPKLERAFTSKYRRKYKLLGSYE